MSTLTLLRGYALVFSLAAIAGTLATAPLLGRLITVAMLAVEVVALIVLLVNFLLSWTDDRSARNAGGVRAGW